MAKRLQVVFTDEAWAEVERVTSESNTNFDVGSIGYSDVVCEMVLASRVDIKALQLKHTDIRRSLRMMAGKADLDLDQVINALHDLRTKTKKRKVVGAAEEVKSA